MSILDNFNKFSNISSKIFKFEDYGEYRKGSNEYGTFIQDIMMFLRGFKKNDTDSLSFRLKNITFDINKLVKLLNDTNKSRLVSFDVKFTDINNNVIDKPDNNGYIIFSNLNKRNDRPWESKDV